MNLIGHVAVALDADAAPPSTEFLVGCMLPDLAAIARVRLARPEGALGDGVSFHHASDAVFHESEWFRATNRELWLQQKATLGIALSACGPSAVAKRCLPLK